MTEKEMQAIALIMIEQFIAETKAPEVAG